LQQQATQGNLNALQILRQRQSKAEVKGNYLDGIKTPSEHFAPQQSTVKVTKKGTVFYLNNKAVIKDDGNRFHVAADADQAVLTSALIHAKNRHGYQLSIQGSELFQENVVRASVKAGLNISFDQDYLEQRRVKLSAEMLLFGDGAVKNLIAQQSVGRRR
jgi:predicted small metal-binding protein